MMQPDLLQPSWQLFSINNSTLDQSGLYSLNADFQLEYEHGFSSSISSPEDSSEISFVAYSPTMFLDDFPELPIFCDDMQVTSPFEDIVQNMEGLEAIAGTTIDEMCRWLDESDCLEDFTPQMSIESEDVRSPGLSAKSSEASLVSSINTSLILTGDDMEIDSQLSLSHLLKGYAEAIEMEQGELAEVIVGCINEKVNPVGEMLERLTFNLFQFVGNQGDYLRQESSKNYESALQVFYQSFPSGRFAHFAANCAIFEAMPANVKTIHIVDFDMGEGVQWPPIIEAIGRKKKALRLTSIRSEEHDCDIAPPQRRFEETKRRLYDHAKSVGLNLKMEEMRLGDLVRANEERKKMGSEREWLAFNAMVSLPHMGRTRRRSHVMEFLKVAKELLTNSSTKKGIITFGDGEDAETMKNCSGYATFFQGCLRHYQALCESMEYNFPMYLAEARIAMESLFVAPHVSSTSWLQKWEDIRVSSSFQATDGLKGWRLSNESLIEAKEMVKEGDTSYRVKMEGQNDNEMVLEWRGTPLVRVSTWA
ncbi:hypothetical protein RJ639_037014 [Escallonia herrerae]|uniref:Nodulation signaling pathway 2-like protein n=1 Tax=Escallonia herrerae TaxID=1293975 RepID=A0AA89BDF9_9ASTE|nr:hypothetical protein RJ639_037014 [Escallonia herrerae]